MAIRRWTTPTILVTGSLGNLLILVVIGTSLHATDTNFFVWVIALADMLVLMCGLLPEWLEVLGVVELEEVHPWSCKISRFLRFTTMDTAIWLMVCFTLERFVAICYPFKKQTMCRMKRIRIYTISFLVCIILKNISVFWTRGEEWTNRNGTMVLLSNCGMTSEFNADFELYIRPWIVFIFSNVIPFMILMICNTMVILTLQRRKKSLVLPRISVETYDDASDKFHELRVSHHDNKTDDTDNIYQQITVMCQVASLAFILCITPSIVLLVGKPYWEDSSGYSVAKAINNELVYVNHSINFYLYIIIGRKFRKQTAQLLLCKCITDQLLSRFSEGSTIATSRSSSRSSNLPILEGSMMRRSSSRSIHLLDVSMSTTPTSV